VLILFGRYTGTVKDSGFWWVNPFTVKKHVTLRIRNFNSERLKVNDLHGNPIEIATVIVWRVVDSARAIFDVQNYEQFVAIQVKQQFVQWHQNIRMTFDDEKPSLRGTPQEIAENLKNTLQTRLEVAGVEIMNRELAT